MTLSNWELLELLGAYFFKFSLVPSQWYEAQSKPTRFETASEDSDLEETWQHYQPSMSVADFCDERLIRCASSPYEFKDIDTVWSDEQHNRVELWETEAGAVAHVDIKVDCRYSSAKFLVLVVELAIRSDCVFFLREESRFCEPSAVALHEAQVRSRAMKLARDEAVAEKFH